MPNFPNKNNKHTDIYDKYKNNENVFVSIVLRYAQKKLANQTVSQFFHFLSLI